MNKKTAIILLGLIAGITIATHFESTYTSECEVKERNGVTITLTDKNGKDWDYIPEGKYPKKGETVLVKFSTNRTVEDNSDDTILKVVF